MIALSRLLLRLALRRAERRIDATRYDRVLSLAIDRIRGALELLS